MKSSEIFTVLEQVASTSKKNEKKDILKEHSLSRQFREVLETAYNPLVTFGIAKRPDRYESRTEEEFSEETWKFLDSLSDRSLTGSAAISETRKWLSELNEPSANLLWRIISKDLRAGISESTINDVFPGLIPEFPYQRCCLPKDAKVDKFDWEAGVFSQVKADGMFLNIDHEECGHVQFRTRQGQMFNMGAVPGLVSMVQTYIKKGTQCHGEMLIFKGGKMLPRQEGNGIINSVQSGSSFAADEVPHLALWDQISLDAVKPKGVYNTPYSLRFAELSRQLAGTNWSSPISVIGTRVVHSMKDALQHALEIQREGGEGTVFKNPHAFWRDGTSKEQVKLKLEVDVELKIVGFTQGTGKFAKTFGALILQSEEGLLETQASGLKDKDRDNVHANWSDYLDSIVTVRANDLSEITGQKAALMHPRIVEFRKDKNKADTLQQVRDQFEAARMGK